MPANNYTYADGRPTVAAIIPLYNGARFIEQAIKSVLEQTLPTHECVVVDDGSTDEGPAILEKLGKTLPIRVLYKRNGGQSSARNFGVAHTTSEFIAFLDQDDVWYPDHLATLIAPFIAQRDNHRLGWCYGDLDEGDEDGHTLTRNFLRTRNARHPKTSVPDCAREDMFVLPSASLIARHAFEAVGGFDERLSGYEDDDLFIRLLDSGFDNVFVDEPVLMWRIYAFSTSYSPRMVRSRMIYARKLLETYGDRLDNDGRRLATSAIAPRFAKALFGEYGRAGRRGDDAAMDQALDDLRGLIGPQLPVLPRLATQVAVTLFRYHPLGRVVTQGGLGIARKVFRWPVDHRAASLQAQADKPRG